MTARYILYLSETTRKYFFVFWSYSHLTSCGRKFQYYNQAYTKGKESFGGWKFCVLKQSALLHQQSVHRFSKVRSPFKLKLLYRSDPFSKLVNMLQESKPTEISLHTTETRSDKLQITFLSKVFSCIKLLALKRQRELI